MSLKLLAASLLAGCTVSGSLSLSLELPGSPDLDPQGMTTVTVIATGSDGIPIANTSVIEGDSFAAGDLPVEQGVQIDVLLRDVSNRLVGVGEANTLVDIKGDSTVDLSIPVRRPFVYAATDLQLLSFDPTLDSRDANFQSQLMGVTAPMFGVSVGGDRLAVISKRAVQAVDTGTNVVIGQVVTLPDDATDAAAVPGTHRLAVSHGMGISIVDLDTGDITTAAASNVERVTVGLSATGSPIAYGLIARVAPPSGPLDGCTGTSQLVSVDVDNPTTVEPMPVQASLSDISADPNGPALFGTDPCAGQVVRLDGTPMNIAPLERAAVLTVLGGRIWAAGSHASTPTCFDANTGADATCTQTSDTSCPPPTGNVATFVGFVTDGASLIVSSIPTDGGDPIVFDVPDRRETIVNTDDDARQHAQVLRAFGTEPLDLVAVPGGQFVALVTQSHYFIEQLTQGPNVILPCLSADTADWLLVDMASVSIASRVRTKCDLVVGPADPPFVKWACDDPPANEQSKFGSYTPASVGALFGR